MKKQEKPPRKVRKKTDMKENLGKVFINLGQVMFGTLFLGSALRGGEPQYIMMAVGFIATVILIFSGLILSAKEQKEKEE